MRTIKVGKTEFNLDALKGVSRTKFLKTYTEEQWEVIEPLVKKKKIDKVRDIPKEDNEAKL